MGIPSVLWCISKWVVASTLSWRHRLLYIFAFQLKIPLWLGFSSLGRLFSGLGLRLLKGAGGSEQWMKEGAAVARVCILKGMVKENSS